MKPLQFILFREEVSETLSQEFNKKRVPMRKILSHLDLKTHLAEQFQEICPLII